MQVFKNSLAEESNKVEKSNKLNEQLVFKVQIAASKKSLI